MAQAKPPIKEITIYRWCIENFSKEAPLKKSYLSSKRFKLNGTGVECWLRFDPTKAHDDSESYSSVHVASLSINDPLLPTSDVKCWIETTHGIKIDFRQSKERLIGGGADCWRSYLAFIHHDQLYNSEFIKYDTVYICCEIRPKGLVNQEVHYPIEPTVRDEKMLELYMQQVTGNCTIQVGTKAFTVDKIPLMAISPVFESMLMSDMQEAKTGVIKITDVEPNVMERLIKYVYALRVQGLDEFAEQLYTVADKYAISDLKVKCTASMISTLNGGNVVRRLFMGFLHNNAELKRATLEYVLKPGSDVNARSIFLSDDWRELFIKHGELAKEIMNAIFDRVNFTPKAL